MIRDHKEGRRLIRSLKKRKPRFINLARYQHKACVKSWRRPRGIDNKQRLKLKSRPKLPSKGYKNPEKIRGLHPSGRIPVRIENLSQLEEAVKKYGSDRIIIYISGTVGRRKRQQIVELGRSLDVRFANVSIAEVS